jgi:hypothetical protein
VRKSKKLPVVVDEYQTPRQERPSYIGYEHRDLAIPAIRDQPTDDPK